MGRKHSHFLAVAAVLVTALVLEEESVVAPFSSAFNVYVVEQLLVIDSCLIGHSCVFLYDFYFLIFFFQENFFVSVLKSSRKQAEPDDTVKLVARRHHIPRTSIKWSR